MTHKEKLAKEMSELMPIFLMNMFPYVFQPIDVPPSQILALICIEKRNGCNLTDIKNDMHVSAPTISGIIDRLDRDKMIARCQDEEDRRVTNVVITKKGKAVIGELRKNIQKRWGYILSRLSDKEADQVISMVRRITQGFLNGTI